MFIFADTTDAGSDQTARRKQTLAALAGAGLPGIFFVDSHCLIHQFHLVVRETLTLIDDFLSALCDDKSSGNMDDPSSFKFRGYFSSLSELANYWRENAGDFVAMWEKFHGTTNPSKNTNYRAYPIRVVAGRWGSISHGEQFILARTRDLLQPVFLALLSKRMKAAKPKETAKKKAQKKKETKTATKTEALVDDDSKEAWHMKLSKWAKGAFQAVKSSLWWLLLEVASTVRKPLDHFFHWCEKNTTLGI